VLGPLRSRTSLRVTRATPLRQRDFDEIPSAQDSVGSAHGLLGGPRLVSHTRVRSRDREPALVKVDVRPPDTEGLAASQSGRREDREQGAEAMLTHTIEESAEFVAYRDLEGANEDPG
jgi:hypothetical protein